MSLSNNHGLAAERHITLPLLRRDSIGNAYHVLSFDYPEELEAQPGQFAMIRGAEWGVTPLLPRPMSLLTGGATPSILVKVVGEGSKRMARAEPGEPFTLLGPLGNTWRQPTPKHRPLLVAGGVGVAPLLFLARKLRGLGFAPVAIFGGRTERDLPLHDDLTEVAETHLATEDGSRGTKGRVTDLLTRILADDMEVFTCGPERMMAKVAQLAADRQVPCEVSLETPMACGYGVCLGCPVPTVGGGYLYACTEGPCIDAARIDWKRDLPPTPSFGESR